MKKREMSPNQAVLLFIWTVLIASWLITILLFIQPEVGVKTFSVIMFIPALVAVLFNIMQGRRLRNPGRKLNAKALAFGICYPLLLVGLCAAVSVLSGVGEWNPDKAMDLKSIITILVTIVVNLFVVLGEEYGWRGFLLPVLVKQYGRLKATFIVGLVWALYHTPAVFLLAKATGMSHPLLICAVQAVVVFAVSFPFSYCFFLSGSLIPVLFFHSIWNVVNTTVLGDIYTNEPGQLEGNLFVMNGEGVMGLIVSGVLMLWFIPKLRSLRGRTLPEGTSMQRPA
ncbi:type II CAAX endopeptidase family protein [Paenibacillus chibensis]|uniref:Type II CAAX endopeptidase family protein n=1 Tax=Paenibacillus chibensis TaxID=59846 RepID=A0ABU6PX94_9BACL|nr:type II CAAX endopeptidase family protein [Paenibacillus chibensis]